MSAAVGMFSSICISISSSLCVSSEFCGMPDVAAENAAMVWSAALSVVIACFIMPWNVP